MHLVIEILGEVNECNPLLVIKPNNIWGNQHGWPAYNTVTNIFVQRLHRFFLVENFAALRQFGPRNMRWVLVLFFLISFLRSIMISHQINGGIRTRDVEDGGGIKKQPPSTICVFHITSLHAHYQNNPKVQLEPIGTAWIMDKIKIVSMSNVR